MRVHKILFAFTFVFVAQAIKAQFSTNGSSIYYNNGNVGIGTSSPGARLGFIDCDQTQEATGITWYNPGSTAYGIHRTAGAWTGPDYQQLRVSWNTGIILDPGVSYGKSYVNIVGNGLRVTQGNVGIGTSSPIATLQVDASNQTSGNAAAYFNKLRAATSAGYNYTFDNVGGVLANNIGAFWRGFHLGAPYITVNGANTFPRLAFYAEYDSYTDPTIKKWVINAGNSTVAHDIQFVSNDLVLMNLKANGSVGIGTANTNDAAYKLFVETGIRTRKIKVDQNSWPDYVFHNNYNLPSLGDLEQYIQQNHHLPEVPSAKEVEKDGLNLGDNQAVLLKKIEELTLYVIEQNKQLKQQQSEIDSLKKQIGSK